MIPSIGNQFPTLSNSNSSAVANSSGNANSQAQSANSAVSNNASPTTSQTQQLAGAAFNPAQGVNPNRASGSSRQDLVELEAVRVRFQLQREAQNGSNNREIQAFLDVADFERREQLTDLVGLDITV